MRKSRYEYRVDFHECIEELTGRYPDFIIPFLKQAAEAIPIFGRIFGKGILGLVFHITIKSLFRKTFDDVEDLLGLIESHKGDDGDLVSADELLRSLDV